MIGSDLYGHRGLWPKEKKRKRKKKAEKGEAKLQVINGPFTPLHHPSSPNPNVPKEVIAFFEVSHIKE